MDYTTCYCHRSTCPLYGQVAPRARLQMHDWQRQGPRLRCERCDVVVSATTGTAYAGIRTDLNTYLSGATALAEGLGIRATGRLVSVDKDTVNHWLPVLGQHCQGVMNYFFRNLHLHECQWDELWTFIHKKEGHLTPLEKLAEVYGDAWVWIAFSPVYKVVPAWVVGKRTLPYARCLLFRLKSATDGYIPFLPATTCPTTLTPCWRCMACGTHRHVKGRVVVFPHRAVTRPPICATRSSSKNERTVGWCT
jgi:transposase-like protein